ncbi:MAG: energy-coupling factor transporter transmembrane protein EcfT [Clostridia bacterium]|nr:energy-coupling factor transporter transmembrane protein EcfT [Clostridia bacterium]MBR6687387.1 energy-coupling factor transporter transmembrane protein EcfT [Clostridia bacterium]
MLSDVAFGQYYPVSSSVHRLDPRTKIVILIAYIVMIFLIKNFVGFVLAGAFLLATIIIAKVPIGSVIKSVKAILFIIIITFIINLFLHKEEGAKVLFDVWLLNKITDKSIKYALFMALRLSFLVFGSSLLTLTTTPVSLTDGIESLLTPLKWIRFPVHELALIMSIALRFIPTLMEETDRIISAQKARGADFETGNFLKKAKALLPVLIPLVISAFRRAEELGDAMDARCYNGSKNRTKYKKLTFKFRDFISVFITAAVFTAVIFANIYLGGIV